MCPRARVADILAHKVTQIGEGGQRAGRRRRAIERKRLLRQDAWSSSRVTLDGVSPRSLSACARELMR